ncbi:unnamed protein product, partial [Clonostachys rosea]
TAILLRKSSPPPTTRMQSLEGLRDWAPVRIDALGLVTILGARSANRVLGQYTTNRFTDWLPLLAAHVIATDEIAEPQSGFALYNITDGIMATDLTGWFTRWLLSGDFTPCASHVTIRAATSSTSQSRQNMDSACAGIFGCLGLAPALLAGLIGDWWGLANGIAILVGVLVRRFVLAQRRAAIDRAMDKALRTSDEPVKVFVTLPNGNAITISTTRGIVIDCLLTTPQPLEPHLYEVARSVGWLAFGAHIIALGMASLFSQIICVVLLISAAILTNRQLGTDRCRIGRCMELTRVDAKLRFRAAAYARLQLTVTEEDSLVLWNLVPHKSNKEWWAKYDAAKKEGSFENWDRRLSQKASSLTRCK